MVDRNCPMDVLNNPISNIQIDTLQKPVIDILNRLLEAGLFRALVIETNGNKVLLDTAFGQLNGVSTEKLSKGDEILARLLSTKPEQSIKVEQIVTAKQALPEKILNQLIKLVESVSNRVISKSDCSSTAVTNQFSVLPLAIKVLGHTTNETLLQLNHKTYSIPRQSLLEKGETLLLKTTANNKVELFRIQPEGILKNALAQLLPRLIQQKNTVEYSHLQKLMVNILKLRPDDTQLKTTAHSFNKNIHTTVVMSEKKQPERILENQKTVDMPAVKSTKENIVATKSIATQTEIPVKLIKQLLSNLSQPVARTDNINAESLQKIFRMLTLIKPATASTNPDKVLFTIPGKLSELHNAVKSSPENFKLLLRQILESNAGEGNTKVADNVFLETSNTLKTELLQQLEQTISQLLAQKTTIRLNQELNQPIQVNINIPIQLNNETTSLKLKLKERNTSDNNEEKHWEINLSFEFALLGLISTNILLQDSKLSAHFWAVKPGTKLLIDTHMDQFKNQLKKSGFELGLFDCFTGKPASQDENSHPVGENLVDIKV